MDRLIYWLIDWLIDWKIPTLRKENYLILSVSTKNDNDVPQLTDYLHFDTIPLQ